jgi:LAGLIDADG endonuclease
MKNLSNIDAAYIAGIIDGEGHIGISRHKTKTAVRGFRYRGRIQIEMTNRSLLRWIKRKCGIGFVRRRPIRNRKWKRQHSLVIDGIAMILFLKSVLRFLRIRRKQAEILLSFQSSQRKPGVKGQSAATRRYQDLVYKQIRKLNKRGRTK